MRRALQFVVSAALLAALGVRSLAQSPREVTISVVSTNDVHGRIWQLPLFGGFVKNLRAVRGRDGGGTLVLDAGDIFQGTLESNSTEGASMIRAYNALGYDAAALGNHEFDFGPVGPHALPLERGEDPLGALKARVREAKFPVLCANLQRNDGKPLGIAKLKAAVLLHPAGIPIGVVGGITENALRATHSGNTQGLAIAPLAAAIAEQAARLRKQGARAVIALVHAGGECHDLRNPDDLASCDDHAEGFALARALAPGAVDLIVGGHTHAGLAQRVHGIPIVEAFSNGRAFARADLIFARGAQTPPSVKIFPPEELCSDALDEPSCASGSYEGAPIARDPAILRAIAADLARAKAERDRPLGVQVTHPIARASKTESPLNNLVADLMLRATPGADAAFSNAGAVRVPLPAGPLSYGAVFEVFPFDNTFAELHLHGRELAAIVAHNLEADGGMIALAGLRAAASCKGGALSVELRDGAGHAIDPERELRVVTSDFLATQGDGVLSALHLAPDAIHIERDRPIRDALVAGLRESPNHTIDGADPQLGGPQNPRIRYPGSRPVHCPAAGRPAVR